jgi:HK97 family phage major capsid protein
MQKYISASKTKNRMVEEDLDMSHEKTKQEIALLEQAMQKFEGRTLNEAEIELRASIAAEIRDMRGELPEDARTVQFGGGRGNGPFANLGEQFMAIKQAGTPSGKADPRLYEIRAAATGLNETVPSEGGFLVQQDFSTEILQNSFDEGELAKLCRRQPIGANANGIKINGVDETSRATGSRFGGVRSYWLAEAEEKQASKPKFRRIELILKKNVVLIYATDELLDDAVALEGFIRATAPKEIAFSVDDCIINGTGAGHPLGILNAGCLVTVAKESGQRADTIVAENVIKMVKRTLGKSKNYVWLHSKSCLDQIYSLSLAVGTGGVPLFIAGGSLPNFPENRLLGLPLIECEQCQALGDLGDLILADLGNGYVIADKGGVKTDMSIHVRFIYDESVFRFVYRVDGQPVLASAITPYKGGASNTESHFVALAERA